MPMLNKFYTFVHSRGDSNIVYLDGVTPPTSGPPLTYQTELNPTTQDEYHREAEKSSSYTDLMSWTASMTGSNKNKTSCPPTPPSVPSVPTINFGGKLNSNHHLKLLQTIREQDEGESRLVLLSFSLSLLL